MWPDNETTVDLLGFDYLVDSLLVILRDDRVLPVTVGVAGDWGSGKSSLLSMACEALRADEASVVTVRFSPWRFESYEDVKAALMAAIVSELRTRVVAVDGDDKSNVRRLFNRLVRHINVLGAARAAARVGLVAGAAHAGASPDLALAAATLVDPIEPGVEAEPSPSALEAPMTAIDGFRREFDDLLGALPELRLVAVFIDDLDRCLPDTIVDTFEAIRLFLWAPKTAFVIAAHQRIVEAAIASRYPANREGDPALGHDYLEKILQVTIALPALSAPEIETYLNLLFAERILDVAAFDGLRERVRAVRSARRLAVSLNRGIAAEALGVVPAELDQALAVTAEIAPVLAEGLRGNPRQVKRFMNTLELRRRAAQGRGSVLRADILAKLMVLEELHLPDFQLLFEWQLAAGSGAIPELAEAERMGEAAEAPVGGWAAQPHIARWLTSEPPLRDVALADYIYLARDRLTPGRASARLSEALQELLVRLGDRTGAIRTAAVSEVTALGEEQAGLLYLALLEQMIRRASSELIRSAIEIAVAREAFVAALVEALTRAPLSALPDSVAAVLASAFSPPPAPVVGVIRHIANSGSAGQRSVARQMLKRIDS
jgi:KAP family P-loop domain